MTAIMQAPATAWDRFSFLAGTDGGTIKLYKLLEAVCAATSYAIESRYADLAGRVTSLASTMKEARKGITIFKARPNWTKMTAAWNSATSRTVEIAMKSFSFIKDSFAAMEFLNKKGILSLGRFTNLFRSPGEYFGMKNPLLAKLGGLSSVFAACELTASIASNAQNLYEGKGDKGWQVAYIVGKTIGLVLTLAPWALTPQFSAPLGLVARGLEVTEFLGAKYPYAS